jgi:hypothetical protein
MEIILKEEGKRHERRLRMTFGMDNQKVFQNSDEY